MLYAIVVSLIAGLVCGYFINTAFLKIFINPLLFTLLLPIMIVIDYDKAFTSKSLKLQLITQLYNFIVIPFMAYFFIKMFFAEDYILSFGFLLYMLFPTAGIAVFWTKKGNGNVLNSIKTMLFGLIIGGTLAQGYIYLFFGKSLNIDLLKIVKTSFFYIFIPLIIGFVINRFLNRKYKPEEFMKLKPKIMIVSQVSIVIMVFIGISMKAHIIVSDIFIFLKIFLPVLIFYIVQYGISHYIGKFFMNYEDSVSFVYSTTLKNISLALGISISLFKENVTPIISSR